MMETIRAFMNLYGFDPVERLCLSQPTRLQVSADTDRPMPACFFRCTADGRAMGACPL